jgi:uncharacterized protein (DUF3084 family)
MTFTEYVKRERHVTVRWNHVAEVCEIRIFRRNGTWRAVAATALEMASSRLGPLELFRSKVRGDSLDQAAIQLLAREELLSSPIWHRPTWLTAARIKATLEKPMSAPGAEVLAPPSSRLPMYRPR